MNLRRRFLFGVIAALAGALVSLPAVAGSETSPTIEAVNNGIYGHSWNPSHAAIGEGASVTLTNPSAVPHGVHWINGPAVPACSAGVPVGTNASASGTQWSGACTFTAAGTYTFYCTVHGSEMTGMITVTGAGAPVVTSTQPAPGGAGTGAGGGSTGTGQSGVTEAPQPSGTASPFAGSAARAVTLAFSQHGGSVHGSVRVSSAGAHGRLEVDLLASSGALAHVARSVRVGKLVRGSLLAGKLSFSVALSGRAKAALKRKGRLALTVKLTLAAAHGSPVTVTRGVVMRP